MTKHKMLKDFVNERLAVAAEEIFALFERTLAEYKEEMCRWRVENQGDQLRADVQILSANSPGESLNQETTDIQHYTEESDENYVKQEDNRLLAPSPIPELSAFVVKMEESSLLEQRQLEDRETEGVDISSELHMEHPSETHAGEGFEPPFSFSDTQLDSCTAAQKHSDLSPKYKSAPMEIHNVNNESFSGKEDVAESRPSPVQNKKRRTQSLGQTSPETMKDAVEMVLQGRSMRETAKAFDISKSTLHRYVKLAQANSGTDQVVFCPQYDNPLVFTGDEEKELADILLLVSKHHNGLSEMVVRELAYQFALKNDKKIPDSWKSRGKAGTEWLSHFLKRQSQVTIEAPASTSLGFCDDQVSQLGQHLYYPNDPLQRNNIQDDFLAIPGPSNESVYSPNISGPLPNPGNTDHFMPHDIRPFHLTSRNLDEKKETESLF